MTPHFEIRFETINSAFDGTVLEESARILREIAASIDRAAEHGKIRDSNGNTIGYWHFVE